MDGRVSRRGLLRTAGGLAAGVALGGAIGRHGYAVPAAEGDFGSTASLALSQRIDLTDDSTELIREKALQNVTVLQSFAIDNVNKRIYTVQVIQGGLQLPGETAPVSGDVRASRGDLCVTQLDLAGNRLGYMYLKGFGHGVQIGVEPSGTAAYLWTETDSVNARGTAIARFKFSNGQVLTNTSSALEKHVPVPGSTNNTCTIDPTTNRLIVRYFVSGHPMYRVYELSDVRARNYTPLVEVPEPYIVGNEQPFQGYAAIGRFLYLLEGSNYGSPGSVYPDGNTHITCVDLNTGALVDRQLTRAGKTLSYREPEGMGVHLPTLSDPSTARLCFGFASGASGARRASIFYKDRKISGTWPRNFVSGDVAMVKAASGVCVSYRVGADGAVWGSQQSGAGGTYGRWGRVSGTGMFTGRPAATLKVDDTIAVYALGVDRKVWGVGQASPGAGFGPWGRIGTNHADVDFASAPSPVSVASGFIVLYALGLDGWIWGCQAPAGGTFGSWGHIGDRDGFVGQPTAMTAPNGTIAIYARRTDNKIYKIGQSRIGAAFGPWDMVGTNAADVDFVTEPSVAIAADGSTRLYALGADGWIWGCQAPLSGNFGAWERIGGSGGLASRPQPLLHPNDTLVLYARGTDNRMRGVGQESPGVDFGLWGVIGTGAALLTGDPSAILNDNRTLVIHSLGSDGCVWGTRQTSVGGVFGTWAMTWPTVRRGDVGEQVRTVQYLLRQHGATLAVDGDFGPITEAAVTSFQSSHGLPATGVVVDSTWSALVVTVGNGSSGEAVKAVQSQLNIRGYVLVVDGVFGPLTEAAVRDFQSGQALPVDGVVAPSTWSRLAW